jgi:hypothetical protein
MNKYKNRNITCGAKSQGNYLIVPILTAVQLNAKLLSFSFSFSLKTVSGL